MELEINNKINNLLFNSNINKEDLDIWKEAQKEVYEKCKQLQKNLGRPIILRDVFKSSI